MAWHELSITSKKSDVDDVTAALECQGALAVTYQDSQDNPILEPNPNEVSFWDEVIITGLFTLDSNIENISQTISQRFPACVITHKPLQDKNWETAWLAHFKPQKFGNSLFIYPSTEDMPTDLQGTTVILSPGLAFGTGQHPTTRLCLEWLAFGKLQNKTILDFGCGTSILAISALKLGAKRAFGIDHDEQALLSSKMNAEKNGISSDALQLSLALEDNFQPCDIVVANILMNPLLSLADTLASVCVEGGTLLLSGLLDTQGDKIIEKYKKWFDFKPYCIDEDWILLVGTKRTTSGSEQ